MQVLDSAPTGQLWRLAFGVWRLAFGVRRSAFGGRRLALAVGVRRLRLGRARVLARREDVPSPKGVFLFRDYSMSSASITTDREDAIPRARPRRPNAERQTPYRIFSRSVMMVWTRSRSASNFPSPTVGATSINGMMVTSILENGFGMANPSHDFNRQ